MSTDIEIPDKISARIPGFKPVYFYPKDLTSEEAYVRLCNGSAKLKRKDFVDADQFKRYFMIASDLLEGTVVITGKERSGKSLFAYHLAYQRRELFSIPAIFNRKPKKGFGAFETIPDDELKAEQDKLNQLVIDIEAANKDSDEPLTPELQVRLESLKFYGRTYTVDEAYKEIDKGHVTNRTRFYGQLARQHGHLHTLFQFISPDPNDIASRYIWDRKTHWVECRYEMRMCKYIITTNSSKVRGLVKTMELSPDEWKRLWDSVNLVGTETLKFYS